MKKTKSLSLVLLFPIWAYATGNPAPPSLKIIQEVMIQCNKEALAKGKSEAVFKRCIEAKNIAPAPPKQVKQ